MRILVLGLLGGLAGLLSRVALLYNDSLSYSTLQAMPKPFTCPPLDETAAVDRFRRLLTFPSTSNVSRPLHVDDPQVFRDMLRTLAESYPLVWSRLKVEEVGEGDLSRLITWPGSAPELEPVLFVSHYDVVPVTPGTEAKWQHPPFSGELAEGHIWGRGSADVKFSVAALLEAATVLLQAGFEPKRTIYFAFGHDEEVSGGFGAGATSALLASRGVTLDVVVDEGGLVLEDGMKPFARGRRVALVGTAEKGYVSVDVRLRSPGGHSSMPPIDGSDIQTQLWRLTTALTLASYNPLSARLAAPVTDMMRELAPYAPAWMRVLLVAADKSKSWVGNRLLGLALRFGMSRETAAMVTNTLVATRLQAGVGDNVLPQEAFLRFNSRILPGEQPEGVAQRVRRAAKLARVAAEVQLLEGFPGSNVTRTDGRHYQLLKRAIQETWQEEGKPDIAVAPMMLMGGTDSKHYGRISRGGILRFVPYGMNRTAGDLGLIHSTNERIGAAYFPRAICSYVRMLELFAGPADGQGEGAK